MVGPYAWCYWTMVVCNVLDPPALLVPLVPDDALGDVRHRGPGQRRDVVRAVRDRGHQPAPRLPAVELEDVLSRPGSTTSSCWAGSACSRRSFLLFIRFVPMVAISEVKACLPAADPHHPADEPAERPADDRDRRDHAAARPTAAVPVYGALARFAGPAELLAAAGRLRAAGYRRLDTYSPFPIHGMEQALGLGRSKVPLFMLAGRAVRPGVRPVAPVVPERHRPTR